MEWLFKWGSLAVAAALTVGLLVLGWMLQGTVERAGQAVTLGEAESLGFAVHERLREAGLPPPPETFDRILKAFAERGLTTVAVVDPEGGVVDAAGPTPKSFPTPGLSFHEGRARLLRPLPPHGPPPGGPGGPPPGAGHPPPEGHPPLLFLEFRPKVEPVLRRETHLILGAMVILCLVVLALGGLVHRAQAQTTDLREALARDRRLAALGEMSAVLAHELRNPLASLKGHAELLAEALPEGRPQAKAERVLGEARRLERLLDDLLDYVRTGTLERAPTDPVALLRRAAEGVGEVLIEAPEGLAEWPLDPRLEQALSNLLRNARQASDEAPQARVEVAAEQLRYTVRDFGEGLEPGSEERIFEAFQTGRINGTGLGLAIARRLVEGHSGRITGANHPEGGALFTIEIPRG